jgi:hypothetical protein
MEDEHHSQTAHTIMVLLIGLTALAAFIAPAAIVYALVS